MRACTVRDYMFQVPALLVGAAQRAPARRDGARTQRSRARGFTDASPAQVFSMPQTSGRNPRKTVTTTRASKYSARSWGKECLSTKASPEQVAAATRRASTDPSSSHRAHNAPRKGSLGIPPRQRTLEPSDGRAPPMPPLRANTSASPCQLTPCRFTAAHGTGAPPHACAFGLRRSRRRRRPLASSSTPSPHGDHDEGSSPSSSSAGGDPLVQETLVQLLREETSRLALNQEVNDFVAAKAEDLTALVEQARAW